MLNSSDPQVWIKDGPWTLHQKSLQHVSREKVKVCAFSLLRATRDKSPTTRQRDIALWLGVVKVLDMNKEKGDAVVQKVGASNAFFVECPLAAT